jgi:hypothetical protein
MKFRENKTPQKLSMLRQKIIMAAVTADCYNEIGLNIFALYLEFVGLFILKIEKKKNANFNYFS